MVEANLVDVPVVVAPGATLPEYQTPGAAGMDLLANEEVTLAPMARALVGTGIRIAVPPGYEAQVRPRSGLAVRHGVALVNSPGTIDSDYRGEIKLVMVNLGDVPVSFSKGDRIGQLVLCPVARARWQPAEELDVSARGEGGFGSTGV